MAISLRKLLEAAGDTLSAPQRNIGSLLSGDGLVDPYSDEADNYNPSELLVKGPGKLTGFGGFAADMLLDPLNLVGVGALGKMGAKAGMKAVEQTARQNAKAAIRQTVDNAMPMPRPQPVANPDARIAYMSKKLGPTDELTAQPTHAEIARRNQQQQMAEFQQRMHNNFIAGKELGRKWGPSLDNEFNYQLAQRKTWPAVKRAVDKRTNWADINSDPWFSFDDPQAIRQELLASSTDKDLNKAMGLLTGGLKHDISSSQDALINKARKVLSPENIPPRKVKRPPSANSANNLLYGKRSGAQPYETNDVQRTAKAQDALNNVVRRHLFADHSLRHHPSDYLKYDTNEGFRLNDATLERDVLRQVPDTILPGLRTRVINRQQDIHPKGELISNLRDAGIETRSPMYSSSFYQRQDALRDRLADKAIRDQLRNQLLGRPPLQSERSING